MQPIPNGRRVENDVAIAATDAPPETLHAVLAAQARDRTKLELWAGTLVGGANAVLMWSRFPSLHWLAAGFAATACYGIWGLLDRKLSEREGTAESSRYSKILMRSPRVLAAALGWAAAIFAIVAFLTAGLSTMGFPGG